MPNLITTPRSWRNKAILLKTEVTANTDAVPVGTANWIEARNVQLVPMEAETAERNIDRPYFGNGGKLQVAQYAKLSFEVAVAGSGAAGTAPKIAPALLACAFAETVSAGVSVAYNPVSTGIGACSIYIPIDGVRHKMVGSRGTVGIAFTAAGIPVWRFEFNSVYIAPDDSAMPAITTTGWPVEEAVNASNSGKLTINGVDLAYSSLESALNSQVERINLPGPQVECVIVDRKPNGSAVVLAPLLAVFNPFALATAGTNVALSTTHGSAAGKKVKIDEKIVITDVAYDQIKGMPAYRLQFEPTPVSGNDEFAATFL